MAGAGHVVGRDVLPEQRQGALEAGIELHRQGYQVHQRRGAEADHRRGHHDGQAAGQAGEQEQQRRGHHQHRAELLGLLSHRHQAGAGDQRRIALVVLDGVTHLVGRHRHRGERAPAVDLRREPHPARLGVVVVPMLGRLHLDPLDAQPTQQVVGQLRPGAGVVVAAACVALEHPLGPEVGQQEDGQQQGNGENDHRGVAPGRL